VRAESEVVMTRTGVALSLLALTSLLWSPPAHAGAPWGRGGEPQMAGGPPPWAAAHGYRHKHRPPKQRHHHHHHHYHHDDDHEDGGQPAYAGQLPDLGLGYGQCNRAALGALLGGVTGGLLGAQIGKGSRRTAATIGGALVGVIVGGTIGRGMDQLDQACVGQALEQAPTGQTIAWTNPDGGHYQITPHRTFQAPTGRYCREYTTEASVAGRRQQLYGTACRQPDGTWERVS
jgi:surface antigen